MNKVEEDIRRVARMPIRHGVLFGALVLVFGLALIARPWSVANFSSDSKVGFAAYVVSMFLGVGLIPTVGLLSLKDWLATGARPRARARRLAWQAGRLATVGFGLAAVIAGVAVVAILMVSPPNLSSRGWTLLVAILGPTLLQMTLLGLHMIELGWTLHSEHAWLRFVR